MPSGTTRNAELLDAFEELRDLRTPLPHRLEHTLLLRPQDIPRVAELGLIASMQPVHILADAAIADRYWGDRGRYAYAFRSLLRGCDADLRLRRSGGDAGPDVRPGGHGGERAPDGTPWHPEQRLSVREALRAYTLGPALATGEAHLKGHLAPNYLADFVVFSEDFLTWPSRLEHTRPTRVFLAGKPIK